MSYMLRVLLPLTKPSFSYALLSVLCIVSAAGVRSYCKSKDLAEKIRIVRLLKKRHSALGKAPKEHKTVIGITVSQPNAIHVLKYDEPQHLYTNRLEVDLQSYKPVMEVIQNALSMATILPPPPQGELLYNLKNWLKELDEGITTSLSVELSKDDTMILEGLVARFTPKEKKQELDSGHNSMGSTSHQFVSSDEHSV